MRCRTTAIIAIAALAIVDVAGCAGDATTSTNSAVTVGAPTSPTVTATTAAIPDTTGPRTTALVPDTAPVAADVIAQMSAVIDEAVRQSASIPGLAVHVEVPSRQLDVSIASGVADRATETPLAPDAGFRIASNTKTFTAAAILRLVEQGRLTLDVPIADLLAPETTDALRGDGYRPEVITVRQVLQHTSGIYDYGRDPDYVAAVTADPTKRWSRLEQVQFAMDHGDPVAVPGTMFAYSDTGYILLGEIIERVTGAPLADAFRTLLGFDHLGLDATYLESLEPAPPGSGARAHQYVGDLDGFDLDPSFDLYGAAGLVSTVGDLSTFYRALLRGEVFAEPGTLATMLDIPPSNVEAGAGMGIFQIDFADNICWSHSGFWGTFVLTCPQIDVTIAASWDQATPAPDFDAELVVRRVLELATAP